MAVIENADNSCPRFFFDNEAGISKVKKIHFA